MGEEFREAQEVLGLGRDDLKGRLAKMDEENFFGPQPNQPNKTQLEIPSLAPLQQLATLSEAMAKLMENLIIGEGPSRPWRR